jgi:hypothetical protein
MFYDDYSIIDIETSHMNLCDTYKWNMISKKHFMNVIPAHLARKVGHWYLGDSIF